MDPFIKKLYRALKRHPQFMTYFRGIEPEQDGAYMVVGAFGAWHRDLLTGKIHDEELLIKQCAWIDAVIATQDAEWIHVMRSEVFSILNTNELVKWRSLVSAGSAKQVEVFLS